MSIRRDSTSTPAFLAALRGERPQRRPLWIMRQAGRYLPEYRATREKATFRDLCCTPELAAEVTLQPLRRFDLDAAIIFSDILTPLAPMGAEFSFADGAPKLAAPLRSEAAIRALHLVEPREELAFVAEAIRLVKAEIAPKPLIGFAGSPFTLAAYLIEGGGGKGEFRHLKTMLYARGDLLGELLDLLAEQVGRHLTMQVEAGADAVQIFDSWAGILSPADHERVVLPRLQRITAQLAPLGVPRILFSKGGLTHLDALRRAGADALSLDWTADLGAVVAEAPDLVLQGNLDPVVLFADPAEVRRRAAEICRAGDAAAGHVFNLGHGILPETPIASVEALVEAVHAHAPEA
jgi:uroporphyrinogen decarboxylase